VDRRYHINLFWSGEDECWIADVPDLRYCSAHGATPEEALREVQVAMEAWLEVQREEGRPVPEPRYRPAIYAARHAA
jgi:predicted RNase H-like HicB family nuclease